jgi:hypothetical protein
LPGLMIGWLFRGLMTKCIYHKAMNFAKMWSWICVFCQKNCSVLHKKTTLHCGSHSLIVGELNEMGYLKHSDLQDTTILCIYFVCFWVVLTALLSSLTVDKCFKIVCWCNISLTENFGDFFLENDQQNVINTTISPIWKTVYHLFTTF